MAENQDKERDAFTGTETTGHDWDGIKELDTPLPRWWLWTFYITIVWGVAYTIAYPAWPMISSKLLGRRRSASGVASGLGVKSSTPPPGRE